MQYDRWDYRVDWTGIDERYRHRAGNLKPLEKKMLRRGILEYLKTHLFDPPSSNPKVWQDLYVEVW